MTQTYTAAANLLHTMLEKRTVSQIWARDIAAWHAVPGSPDAASITNRLGWLDVARTMSSHLGRVAALAESVRAEGTTAVYLLGMGGSSLCAEVMRAVFGVREGYPDLFVLDTTDEQTILAAADRMDPATTLFLVASKSGGTVEVASLERFFWSRVSATLGERAGSRFVAVTDPGTPLQTLGETRGYREVFLNPPDIGGRFSALSLFGLVPAALIGAPVKDLLSGAEAMAEGCQQENAINPGLQLGAFIAAAVNDGRDKLTLALSPRLATLGLWIEQLVAESTGKHGTGALPVVDEPLGSPAEYGTDRAFVAVASEFDAPDNDKLDALSAAGHPVLHLTTRIDGLGAEFFRWEFATAIAGAALGINPFDEPNVSEAKEKTRALLTTFVAQGRLEEPTARGEDSDTLVFSREPIGTTPPEIVRHALTSLRPGDYVAFLSYLPASLDVEAAIAHVRQAIRSRTHAASTFGVGPRYLHSTGQYHKGGPDKAHAFVITGDDATSTEIPDAGYSFSVLKRAQALGDVQTLEAHSRPTIRIHVKDSASAARAIERLFSEAWTR